MRRFSRSSRRFVLLRGVMELDDLCVREKPRRLRRETHHQRRAEREIRHDERTDVAFTRYLAECGALFVGPAACTDYGAETALDR